MTDSHSALSEVPALLDERRRYESWLAALAARRESTPLHVFERVQADYRARLERVAGQLESHRHVIEEECASLQSQVSLLEADERLRRDERAELDLRAHVGELAGEEAITAFDAVDGTIAQLVEERQGLEARIAELSALLSDGTPEPEPEIPAAEPEAATEAAPSDAVAAADEPVAGESSPAPPPDVSVPVEHAVEPAVASAPAAEPSAPPPPVPSAPPAPPAHADAPRPRGARGSFDELAFLSSVVGKNDGGAATAAPAAPARKEVAVPVQKPDAPLVERRSSEPLLRAPVGVAQEENASESLLAGVENAKLATGEHPLAANVSANTPIVLRPSTTLEQAKTLKCNECGGLNYPTEWYCERCGAELAAL
ncbi:MAG: hypothetical protein ACREPM_23550 [Gemmatimonadaceae bacterium]